MVHNNKKCTPEELKFLSAKKERIVLPRVGHLLRGPDQNKPYRNKNK
jgi:hypothetical protein